MGLRVSDGLAGAAMAEGEPVGTGRSYCCANDLLWGQYYGTRGLSDHCWGGAEYPLNGRMGADTSDRSIAVLSGECADRYVRRFGQSLVLSLYDPSLGVRFLQGLSNATGFCTRGWYYGIRSLSWRGSGQ